MTVRFRKVHGAGNDFILVTGAASERDWRVWGPWLCARRTGVGADGLVISDAVAKDRAILAVLCVNPDGSVATLCANALRCAAWCASLDHGWTTMSLVMAGVPHEAVVEGSYVRVTVEAREIEPQRFAQRHQGGIIRFDSVRVGAKHLVALVDDVNLPDLAGLVQRLRHRDPATADTNISVVQSLTEQELTVRTYESSAQEESLSCASGAVAAAVIATHRGLVDVSGPVTVHNRAGSPLTVTAHTERPLYWVGGPVTYVFDGELDFV
ncbi:diaminopimelate epimerase [Streptomyces marokkonensis]|uniref:Diaminopimelate epimerase n=1 Tax=Streptomyces marokkonensis TaxID=324855 RepID=A0ABW6QHM5_9ACTN